MSANLQHHAERLPDSLLISWLQEDAPHGDLTTRALALGVEPAHLQFSARRDMRVALIEDLKLDDLVILSPAPAPPPRTTGFVEGQGHCSGKVHAG